ncbi:hypothetical protein [Chitinophaga sancti]|uniref:Uncharacterized protein n=1 Tax=Chitinophaga sancti TaxID=1004 RepID=A0A1K1SS03_9BACT|nr:hypothetical protein [Chitinophaga sancti]WQD61061.1 hypothetical protein U0033_24485 [Chitinophaga sancti]WQG86810.1 hypothetical protein SR876_17980 [Chitinophaga sancti]SFW86645.1 hypothetical protein SAMN05661012_05942 [Chitinophaga sancti]
MKRHILYLCLILSAHSAMATMASHNTTDTTSSWIDQIRTLRDAIYHRDKETTKTFFSFPFNSAEFWYIVDVPHLAEKEAPVTEKSFDLYFDKIFDKAFITSFLKIKTKDLYEKGSSKTAEFTDDQAAFYSMEATFDKEEQTVTLQLSGYNKKVDPEIGGGEYAIFYVFKLKSGKLKFDKITMAG